MKTRRFASALEKGSWSSRDAQARGLTSRTIARSEGAGSACGRENEVQSANDSTKGTLI